jgi:uncharacterized protein YoxC
MLAYTTEDVVNIALAAFLVLVALSIGWVALATATTLERLSSLIKGTQAEVLPVVSKVGTTLDHVNDQMVKVDHITDSAVDAADSADTAVRAVSLAVTRPVQKVSGFAAGVSHGYADFKVHRNLRSAVDAGKEAAATREQELVDELRDAGREGGPQPAEGQ